jgi:hypothetical protein
VLDAVDILFRQLFDVALACPAESKVHRVQAERDILGVGRGEKSLCFLNRLIFSSEKAVLNESGKGLGRFIWLVAFDHVEIDSTFSEPDADGLLQRKFTFDTN